jgi:DNA topoisomerase-1
MSKKSLAGKTLVIVESPTKAKTIRKFLGKDFIVESCMGHVRDLPQSAKDIPEKFKKQKWASLGVDVDHDFEPVYCVPKNKLKIVKELKEKLSEASFLYLATDEDREGESISWHLLETLKPKVPYKRMVFHEITEAAIKKSLKDVREIDFNLVKAQEARRILDRLVGYTISPLIWKKVAYGLSAGRVQSVAVKLLVEREHERIRFKKSQYWDLQGQNDKDNSSFETKLNTYKSKRLASGKDFDSTTGALLADKKSEVLHLDAKAADKLLLELKGQAWKTSSVEEKPFSRKPPAPFITSTLQQDSNRKLGLSARETMQVAQSLYEQGFITYMRTDSTFLSTEALESARSRILSLYGKEYLPETARTFEGKKAKGAQEAHEAIRPSGTNFLTPDETGLKGPQYKLYELIWKRTMACQMVNSKQNQVAVRFQVGDAIFSASGMTIEFPGFLRAYVEGSDDEQGSLDEKEVRLPDLKVGDIVNCSLLEVSEHETKPPARYTDASLVQTMEKEGIGRPSTYAAVISTIIDRGYAKRIANALNPTFTAMVVAKLLQQHLPQYVDLGFTSSMEQSLDDIADGDLDEKKYLKSVYFGEKGLLKQVQTQEKKIDPDEARSIHLEGLDGLSFRVGRFGAYVSRTDENGEQVSASLPEAQSPADITREIVDKLIDQKINGTDALGVDPVTQLKIYVLTGRYGPYVQLGESTGEDAKPKRVSIPPQMPIENVGLPQAIELLQLPKNLGPHPGTGKDVKAGLGRFGPYIVHDGDFRSIPKTDDLFKITFERAIELLSQPKKGRGKAAPIKELGKHPDSIDEVQVYSGKFGPYIKAGKFNVSVPETIKPEDITMAQAVELLASKNFEGSQEKAPEKTSGKSKKSRKKLAQKSVKAQKTEKLEAPVKAIATKSPLVKVVVPTSQTSSKAAIKKVKKSAAKATGAANVAQKTQIKSAEKNPSRPAKR